MHLIEELILPDRYERLVSCLGAEVASLLTAPAPENITALRALVDDVYSRDEGVLVPVYGGTGVGKTTFVMNASQWLPNAFGATCQYEGELTFEGLVDAAKRFSSSLPANNEKILPINIDHRENAPPNDSELSAIKRFLRTNAAGVPSIIFWPETSREVADTVSERYVNIAGGTSIQLPLVCSGPDRSAWQDIAVHTLSLANKVPSLESLGVDPRDYDPAIFPSLGGFLRKISQDFKAQVREIKAQTERPLSVVIVFASESADPGILTQLTSSSRYGLLDAHALISVTSNSEVGKWWSSRRGLLTKTIVQLDAHAICLAPTAAASSIRNFSDEMPLFDEVGYKRYGPARGVRDLMRSDLGKLVSGESLSRFEARGTPGDDAAAAFQLLAESGFNLGRDKNLNLIMSNGLRAVLDKRGVQFEDIRSEQKLPFCALIPDNSIFFSDRVVCVEYTWRKGEFLDSSKRSAVAQYALEKLRAYARQLGWTND